MRPHRTVRPSLAALLLGVVLGGLNSAEAILVADQPPAPELTHYERIAQWPDRARAGDSGDGIVGDPTGLDLSADDRVYISDGDLGGVHTMLPDGRFQPPFGVGGPDSETLGSADGLAVFQADDLSDSRVYVLDRGKSRVVWFDLDGRFGGAFGPVDGSSLAVGPDGRVFVADKELRQIRVFDADGRELFTIGEPGTGNGQFSGLVALGVGPAGERLAVGDLNGVRLQVFGLSPRGARFERAFDLTQPKFSQSTVATVPIPPYYKCRAGIVHVLDSDSFWIGDGTGACTISSDGFDYVIASSAA